MSCLGGDTHPGLSDEGRGRVYGFLAALFSHPDEGRWGCLLNGNEQRIAIKTVDALRSVAASIRYPVREDELPCEELDLRCLIVELCQPLEHLKAEYERVLSGDPTMAGHSPYEFDYRPRVTASDLLIDLVGVYERSGYTESRKLLRRPDHIGYELDFMGWLIMQRRLAIRMAPLDAQADEQARAYDLAQRNFFSDHLGNWLVAFAAGLRNDAWGGYFEPLGRFLAAWIPLERWGSTPVGMVPDPGSLPRSLPEPQCAAGAPVGHEEP